MQRVSGESRLGRRGVLYGVIAGTGVADLLESPGEQRLVQTPYGEVAFAVGTLGGQEAAFINRHGPRGFLLPHRVNYRGNIFALRDLGVQRVLATAAVGAISEHLIPGHFVLLDEFLDFTKARPLTFFDQGDRPPVHVDVSEAYCPNLRGDLTQAGLPLGERLHPAGTYLCAEGPRFETPAEIQVFRSFGADVVGMTGVPEVVLAREAGLCYASAAVVTNWAAGIASEPLDSDEVAEVMRANMDRLRDLFAGAIARGADRPGPCRCQSLGGEWPP
jgi:5'-methylthioadenosine phosphorylase